jgi:hypothetical protein
VCPILCIPLKWNKGKAYDNSYSFDRIDNNGAYEIGNIVVVSNRANRLKGNATVEELVKIAEFYKNIDNLK